MKIVVYYSVGFDYNPEPRLSRLGLPRPQGKPMGRPFPDDWMSFHSPYRQYVIDHLVEIMRLYGRIDGLWLDIFSSHHSRETNTRSRLFKPNTESPLRKPRRQKPTIS